MEKGSAILISAGGNNVGLSRNLSFSFSRNLIETTNKDSNWKKREYGRGNFSIASEGVTDVGDAGQKALFDALDNGTAVSFSIGKATPTTGDRVYSGSGISNSHGENFEENAESTFSNNIEGTGDLTITTTS